MGRATVTVLPMRRTTRWSLLLLTTSLPFSAIEPPGFSVLQPFPIILENSATPQRHQIETMPGGVAIFDFDNDGRPDVFFTNGATQPGLTKDGPKYANHLYRNLGNFKFEDVTKKAGLEGVGYSMGAAVGDIDHDGFLDLFVTGVGQNILYRNRGDGTFEKRAFPSTGWSISAGFFDYNGDGHLDLFIVNYVQWDPAKEPFCGELQQNIRTYCHPKYYQGLANSLFRNDGKGNFTDVSQESGIGKHIGKGMGLAFADYDNDGHPDVAVTNDTTPNFLFHNEGNGTFREVGMSAGIGLNDDGRALSSMGIDFRDIDNDGRPDLFLTALANETFPLYRNLGKGLFQDITYPTKIGQATLPWSGWSTAAIDFDNDGWKDLFTANGDVNDNTEKFSSRASRQHNAVLWNTAGKTFRAEQFGTAALYRGAAFADLDGDGAVDIVVTRLNESPVILRNTSAVGRHWIGFHVPLGTLIHIRTAAGEQWNHATAAVGYASSSDPGVHFGLGAEKVIMEAEFQYPGGKSKKLQNLTVDRYLTP